MKYEVKWIEHHATTVEADSQEEAEIIGVESSDGNTTYQTAELVSCKEVVQ